MFRPFALSSKEIKVNPLKLPHPPSCNHDSCDFCEDWFVEQYKSMANQLVSAKRKIAELEQEVENTIEECAQEIVREKEIQKRLKQKVDTYIEEAVMYQQKYQNLKKKK